MPVEERSLGEVADPTAASPFGTPNPAPGEAPTVEPPAVSIIDTILQLDSFLSGDVRRAEKTARFCSKPWLEADIDALVFELEALTDEQGYPLPGQEAAAQSKAVEIQTKQSEMGASFVSVRMAQLASDRWLEFMAKWREEREKPGDMSNEFWNEVIELSAKTPTITAAQVVELRTKLGDPQMDTLAKVAWDVNTQSGVSIPKSPLSSLVLRRGQRSKS